MEHQYRPKVPDSPGPGRPGTALERRSRSTVAISSASCSLGESNAVVVVDITSRRLDLDRFVSETISIGDVEEAFHKMERGEVLRSVVVMP